jgi:hypothetical protein
MAATSTTFYMGLTFLKYGKGPFQYEEKPSEGIDKYSDRIPRFEYVCNGALWLEKKGPVPNSKHLDRYKLMVRADQLTETQLKTKQVMLSLKISDKPGEPKGKFEHEVWQDVVIDLPAHIVEIEQKRRAEIKH